jgi:hypothetical protein
MPDVSDITGLPDWLKAILSQQSVAPGGGLFSGGDVPAPQNIGLLAGGPPAFTSVNPDAPAFQTGPTAVQDQYADVPLPPRRPPDASMFQANASDVTSSPTSLAPPSRPNANVEGTPASGAPEAVAPAAPQSPGLGGYLGKASDLIGSIYGAGGPGDALIALGLSNRTGGASIQALNAGILNRSKQADLALKQAEANDKIKAIAGNVSLVKKLYPNMGDAEASAFARNPEMMKQIGQVAAPMEQWTSPYKDEEGNWLKRNTRTGNTEVLVKGDPAWKDLTDPSQRLLHGIQPSDAGVYQVNDSTNQLRNINERGAITINNAVNPVLKGAGEALVSQMETARASANTVRAIASARQELDRPGGVIAGFRANDQLAMQKLGTMLGVSDPEKIKNTESFLAAMKPIVLETVKGLGAGAGISNADREFAAKAVGGDITLDEGSLRRILDITERAARYKIEAHNKMADEFIKSSPETASIAPILKITPPEPYGETSFVPETPRLGASPPMSWSFGSGQR